MEDVKRNAEFELVETLKKLIQGDKALVRQMKRTIAVVDKNLRRKPGDETGRNSQSKS